MIYLRQIYIKAINYDAISLLYVIENAISKLKKQISTIKSQIMPWPLFLCPLSYIFKPHSKKEAKSVDLFDY